MAHPYYFPGDTTVAPFGRVSLAQAPSWPDGLPPGSSGAMPVGSEWLASAKAAMLVAAERESVRLELLADAERIEPHFALASSYLRDFARRLEFKP